MLTRLLVLTATLLATATSAWAQAAAPPPAPKVWTVNAGAGLALTGGNTDTSTVNAAYDLVYDPQTKNIVKSDLLYIHGTSEGELTASRLGFNVRDEYKLTPRVFLFGQNQYLRDEFKNIDWLLAPGGGLGVKLFDSMQTKLSVDGGLASVWEKNSGFEVRTSGAVTASERLTQTLTATTTITQSVTALWKTKDWDDSLYTFGAGIAASISTRTQLKVEVLDVFKNLPPTPDIKKNDVALLMSIVYKI
jgi:putative salt-induced outer membrane protein YdiY